MLGGEMLPHKSSCLCTSAASIVILRRRYEPNPMGACKYIPREIGDSGMTNSSEFLVALECMKYQRVRNR